MRCQCAGTGSFFSSLQDHLVHVGESKHLGKRVDIAARSAAHDYSYVADSQAIMIPKSVDVVYALTEFECESTATIGKLNPALGTRA